MMCSFTRDKKRKKDIELEEGIGLRRGRERQERKNEEKREGNG